jgi:hypothetical protein
VTYFCSFGRGFLVFVLAVSFLVAPLVPAYARGRDDGGHGIPLPPGLPLPPGVSGSLRVTAPPLPPGVPVPVPVPGVPYVERHRYPPDRVYVSSRRDHRDYRYRPDYYRHRPYGSVHHSLPAGFFALSVAGAAFFYHSGLYYRQTPAGYVVVQAPFGARVRVLPEECTDVYIDGRRYYDCDEVFYEPDGDEYIVIERPSGFRIIAEVGDEVRVKAEYLNVRSGPSTRHRSISKLYRGDVVEVGGVDGEWYYIRLANGQDGWIMRDYTRIHRTRNDVKG